MKRHLIAVLSLVGLAGCAGMKNYLSDAKYSRIEARGEGLYVAIAEEEDKSQATKYASAGAKSYCEKRGKHESILKTTFKYDGLTTEKGDQLLNMGRETAAALAGASVLNATRAMDDVETKHEVLMEFRCE